MTTADTTRPIVRAPRQHFPPHSTLGSSGVPIQLTWSASDSSGIAMYQLQRSADGRAYSSLTLPTATTTAITSALSANHNYRFRVRAQDRAGNWSAWAYGPRFVVAQYQESHGATTYSGGWTSGYSSWAYGRYVRYTTVEGARARFTFTGRNVAWVATRGPDRGEAAVYLDGAYVRKINLYSSAMLYRRVVFAHSWASPGTHTLEVRALGTADRPRVDFDAFMVLHSDPVSLVAGDIATCSTSGDEATARLLDGISGTVFTTGDNVYPDGTAAQFTDCYGPSWGRHKARTRPSVGNHEYRTTDALGYFRYFGSAAGDARKGYYS